MRAPAPTAFYISQGLDTGRPDERFLPFRSPPSSAPFGGHLPPCRGKACGRPGGAAPTAGLEAVIPFRRGRTLAGPHTRRAEVVAPYTKKRSIIAPSSAPVCALGHLPPRGRACRRLIAAPTANQHQCRWFGKPRRRCGTAPAAIFANPGPGGPAGIHTLTQISARRKFFAWFKG